jgi:hypothetical protein
MINILVAGSSNFGGAEWRPGGSLMVMLASRLWERFLDFYSFLRWLRAPFRLEKARSISWKRRLQLAVWGFFGDKDLYYQLDSESRRVYLTDCQMLRTRRIDGRYSLLLQDKVVFQRLMTCFARVPQHFAVLNGDRVDWLDPTWRGCTPLDLVHELGIAVLKPVSGQCGIGVRILESEGGVIRLNGEPIEGGLLSCALCSERNTVLMEYVRQGVYGATLYPGTVNTIRLLTLRDPELQWPFLAGAVQRIGCRKSFPVDNVSLGGLVCGIDLESGRLSRAATGFGVGELFRIVKKHPETSVCFEELSVPNWADVCDEIVKLAARFPMLPYVAWDVALTHEGVCVIEANHWSDVRAMQIYHPLLADKRVRRFYQAHGVL